MNKAEAIKMIKSQGGTVTAIKSFKVDETRIGKEFFVNGVRIHHNADGGAGCWRVDGVRMRNVVDCVLSVVGVKSECGRTK